MLNEPKVLVAIPTYQGKDYVFNKNFEAVKSFDYSNYDYVYIDNSRGSSYAKKLRMRGANVVRVPRGSNSRQALTNAQNFAKDKVLRENYDYLLFVESDLVPPRDTIKRLISRDKPVVGSLYFLESFSNDIIPSYKINKFVEGCLILGVDTSGLDFEGAKEKGYLKLNNFKMRIPCIFYVDKETNGTRLIKPNEIEKLVSEPLSLVHGCGLGCTLIKRELLVDYLFWWDVNPINAKKHSDVYFYLDLHRKGIPVFVDTTVVIPHFPSKWDDVEDR